MCLGGHGGQKPLRPMGPGPQFVTLCVSWAGLRLFLEVFNIYVCTMKIPFTYVEILEEIMIDYFISLSLIERANILFHWKFRILFGCCHFDKIPKNDLVILISDKTI